MINYAIYENYEMSFEIGLIFKTTVCHILIYSTIHCTIHIGYLFLYIFILLIIVTWGTKLPLTHHLTEFGSYSYR